MNNLPKIQTTNDGAKNPNEKALSAEEIIKKVFGDGDLRTDLREMIDVYLLSEDEPEYRDQRYSSFMWIDSLLKDIQLYQAQSQIKVAS